MTRKAKPPTRLSKARSEAAKELKLPVTDWRVRRYAILMTAYSNAEGMLAEGATIDIKALLEIEAALMAIKQSLPPEPLKVTIDIVGGTEPKPKKDFARTIDGEVVKAKPEVKPLPAPKVVEAEAPAPPPPPPPKPLTATQIWEMQNGYSAHAAPDGGPGRIGGRGLDPALREPHPYLNADGSARTGHPLPTPNGGQSK
jgi:hypothetical protein